MPNILDLYHIDTTTVAGRTEAREILQKYTSDVVLLDYMMGVIKDNANLLADMCARDEEDTSCSECDAMEEQINDLESEVSTLHSEINKLERELDKLETLCHGAVSC